LQSVIAQKNYPQSIQPPSAMIENLAPIEKNNSRSMLQIERDAHGKIKRSEKAKDDFKAANPCPANGRRSGSCPGYVIDHINPLACGGADSPENMQWQTITDGKAKDGWERDHCKTSTSSLVRQFEPVVTDNLSQTVYIGKRGGRYIMSKSGKKRYLKR
jgi:hypothetical protein